MKKNRYLALLRGINVGGKNIIKMADLKMCFENNGFTDIKTYIQSGNILFSSEEKNCNTLINKIAIMLSEKFKYNEQVFVLSEQQLKTVVTNTPAAFGAEPENYKYDVMFVKSPQTPADIAKQIKTKEKVDKVFIGEGVVFISRLKSKASQSYMPKIVLLPFYKDVTIRNWNTTSKLFALMEQVKTDN